ncbi:MAG: DUF192 domain-containing protein, partial [Acidobacteriota bacterium]|nr:DUF192 domain-containing protein [Acidobacteriota bacterium]
MTGQILTRRILSLFLLGLLAISSLYCQVSQKDKFIKVYLPNGKEITAELAVSPEARERGLMYREKIEPDQGMLFVFEEEDL